MSVRVTVELPGPAVEVLKELAKKRNHTMTEVLRHAISLEQQVDEELSQGAKMLIQKKDGSLEEVVFP